MTSVLPVPDVRLEAAERSGYRDYWEATPPGLAARLGMAHAEVGAAHLTAVAAAPGVRVLNHVLGVPGDGPIDPDELAAIERFYAARGLPALLALPAGAPGEAQLAARGYERDYAWVKFARDLAPAPAVAAATSPCARLRARTLGRWARCSSPPSASRASSRAGSPRWSWAARAGTFSAPTRARSSWPPAPCGPRATPGG